jgi:5-hydroxyisourate hydrolase-like protein (transthyretin family)
MVPVYDTTSSEESPNNALTVLVVDQKTGLPANGTDVRLRAFFSDSIGGGTRLTAK